MMALPKTNNNKILMWNRQWLMKHRFAKNYKKELKNYK